MEKFKELTIGSTHLTRRHIILLSSFFGVSRQAMVMRLEELGLTKKGTWDWFMDNGVLLMSKPARSWEIPYLTWLLRM